MSTLYITEFSAQAADRKGFRVQAPAQPPEAEQTVAIAGASAQSAALQPRTTIVRLHTDVICSVSIGLNPTATTASARMGAGDTEYFAVPLNSGFKIAVIANS